MTKISALPQDTSPTMTDSFATLDQETLTTKRTLLSAVRDLFFTQTNIPAGGGSPVTRDSESMFAFIASGGVITADSVGVNRNASMTAMICYINGRRISIAAVTARTYTASKDTYVDCLDNGDGTGTLVYTEVVNNAASPALAANSIRVGIVVTGATTIAATGSINQGQEDRILPIASSIAYTVTDSLGNLICPRDPSRRVIGYRQILTVFSTAASTDTQITGLSCPVIVPTGRRVRVSVDAESTSNSTAGDGTRVTLWEGAVGATQLRQKTQFAPSANPQFGAIATSGLRTPSSASLTYNAGLKTFGAGTASINAFATSPAYMLVELY